MKFLNVTFCTLCTGLLHAQDKVTLTSGEVLHGNILSISRDQTISLQHQGSTTPFQIDATLTKRLDLTAEGKKIATKPSSIIALQNGDLIPGSVKSITKENVVIASQMMGTFTLKRTLLDYIAFGNSVFYPIYKFNNVQKTFEQNRGWVVNKGALEAQQTAEMWKKLPLTDDFIVKCQLQWTGSPQVNLHLGAVKTGPSFSNYRYQLMLQNSSTTMTLFSNKIRSKAQRAAKTLRTYRQKVDLEVWVSQSKGEVTLFFDGKEIHSFGYPVTPSGNYIGIQNQSSSNKLVVKNLEVATWDGKQNPNALGFMGNRKNDIIITKNDNRYSGKVLSTTQTSNGLLYNSTYQHSTPVTQPIAEKDIQVIKFASAKPKKVSKLKPSLLEGGTKLKLSNIRIENKTVFADHEVLGSISIPKKFLSSLELNN